MTTVAAMVEMRKASVTEAVSVVVGAAIGLWDGCACDAVLGMASHRTEFT